MMSRKGVGRGVPPTCMTLIVPGCVATKRRSVPSAAWVTSVTPGNWPGIGRNATAGGGAASAVPTHAQRTIAASRIILPASGPHAAAKVERRCALDAAQLDDPGGEDHLNFRKSRCCSTSPDCRSRRGGRGRLKISAMMLLHSSSVMERSRAPRSSSSTLLATRQASMRRRMSFFSRSSIAKLYAADPRATAPRRSTMVAKQTMDLFSNRRALAGRLGPGPSPRLRRPG